MKYKLVSFTTKRRFSTDYLRYYSKSPAENSSSGKCDKKISKCAKMNKKKICKINQSECPKQSLLHCEQSKGSDCHLNYLGSNCGKKFAPYPSYSESCGAENLPDDPSECQQCPWRTCDGADTIIPGKPVRQKRQFSTTSTKHLSATSNVNSYLCPPINEVQAYIFKKPCGNIKQPCKQPPGLCEVRKEREERNKLKRDSTEQTMPKKSLENNDKALLPQNELLRNPYDLNLVCAIDEIKTENNSTRISFISLDSSMHLNDKNQEGKKHPNCHKRKNPKRPPATNIDILKNKLYLTTKGSKKIKGDEGHPPPCEEKGPTSLRCPPNMKKPKYKKRPMTRGVYKRPDEPYSPSS